MSKESISSQTERVDQRVVGIFVLIIFGNDMLKFGGIFERSRRRASNFSTKSFKY